MKLLIGSHVSMSGREGMLGSVKEAASYGANTFMLYTGAPQNTRRRPVSELNVPAAHAYMERCGIGSFVVHAPYLINLAATHKPELFSLSVELLASEMERACAMGSNLLILHPGSHVGAGDKAGIRQIIEGLNAVLSQDTPCLIALETMAGKGSELGRRFEELAAIYDGAAHPEKLRVCFDTCHTHDAGYDIRDDFSGVIERFDRLIGKREIAVFHINDSKSPCGAAKDRHANIGQGQIGLEALRAIVHHPDFLSVPKILETPWLPAPDGSSGKTAPYREEIRLLSESGG